MPLPIIILTFAAVWYEQPGATIPAVKPASVDQSVSAPAAAGGGLRRVPPQLGPADTGPAWCCREILCSNQVTCISMAYSLPSHFFWNPNLTLSQLQNNNNLRRYCNVEPRVLILISVWRISGGWKECVPDGTGFHSKLRHSYNWRK